MIHGTGDTIEVTVDKTELTPGFVIACCMLACVAMLVVWALLVIAGRVL